MDKSDLSRNNSLIVVLVKPQHDILEDREGHGPVTRGIQLKFIKVLVET